MSKKGKEPEGKSFESIEETLSKSEIFIQKNQKILTNIVLGILIIVAGYMAWKKYYYTPHAMEAQSQMFMAINYFEKDSFNLALNGDGNYLGFYDIIDEYSSTPAGNLAKYYAGIANLHIGNYEEALDQLKSFSSDDLMVSSMTLGAIGDIYAEMGDNDNAISYYRKAAESHPNDFTTPIFLFKEGLLNEITGNYDEALKAFETIQKDYPRSNESRDMKKYITRVKLQMEQQ
jgi:tetratricopeptide (TPR) repeat protein